jgi:hypothetical protein
MTSWSSYNTFTLNFSYQYLRWCPKKPQQRYRLPARSLAMDLKFTPEEEAFRQEVVEWFDKNLPSREERPRAGGLGEETAAEFAKARLWHRKLYEGGWIGMSWPKQ